MIADVLQILSSYVLSHSVFFIFGLVVIHLCINKYGSMSDVPGPMLAGFSQLYKVYYSFRGNWHEHAIELHKRYGSIVRIAPREAMVADIKAAKSIYGHSSQMKKSNWYSGWHRAGNETLFSTQDSSFHGPRKRKTAHVYSLSNVVQMETRVDDVSKIFMDRMDEMAARGQPIDIAPWMQMYAFDVIGQVSYGKSFGLLTNEMPVEILDAVKTMNDNMTILAEFPLLHSLSAFNWFQGLLNYRSPKLGPALAKLLALPQLCVTERSQKTTKSDSRDMLGQLLMIREEKGQDAITNQDMLSVMLQNIFAGSDTTAAAFRAILYHLMSDSSIYKKLQAEIDTANEAGSLSEYISFAESQTLPYLGAVIKEALRFNPSVGFFLPRVVPSDGHEIGSFKFKHGDVLGINPWVGHRDTSVFGPDAAQYNPERWLESKERTAEMDRYSITFGDGSRTCIGKNISIMELHKLVPQFLRSFDIAWADPNKCTEAQWSIETKWFCYQTDMMITLKRRRVV